MNIPTRVLLLLLALTITACSKPQVEEYTPLPSQWDMVRGNEIAANLETTFSTETNAVTATYMDGMDQASIEVSHATDTQQAAILSWVQEQQKNFNTKPLEVHFRE